MRVAVVGAGLGGLAAAWWLGQVHAVTLFERLARPGFTAAGVAVPGRGSAGNGVRVDVPLRVFYPGYYPTLTRLYQALGVPSEPVSYAASFVGADGRLLFRYRNLGWGSRAYGVVARRRTCCWAATPGASSPRCCASGARRCPRWRAATWPA